MRETGSRNSQAARLTTTFNVGYRADAALLRNQTDDVVIGSEAATMESEDGGWFDPETLALMKAALDDAWASLTEEQRRRAGRTGMAMRILALAKTGVRDAVRLRSAAMAGVAPPTDPAS